MALVFRLVIALAVAAMALLLTVTATVLFAIPAALAVSLRALMA